MTRKVQDVTFWVTRVEALDVLREKSSFSRLVRLLHVTRNVTLGWDPANGILGARPEAVRNKKIFANWHGPGFLSSPRRKTMANLVYLALIQLHAPLDVALAVETVVFVEGEPA